MSGRYHDYHKGSSRSTRDDFRTYDGKREARKSRSRSRSPRRHSSPPKRKGRHSPDRSTKNYHKNESYEDKRSHERSKEWNASDEEVPAPPPPPRISKISIGFQKPKAPIKMNLSGLAKPNHVPIKPTIASVFNADDDDEPEEMPAEARMRMRNIGRETPTSAGPNSFGKTKQGFCDAKKVFEKNLKQALETADKTGPSAAPKFPQTIYKIKGP